MEQRDKSKYKYVCDICPFYTQNKSLFNRHTETKKHVAKINDECVNNNNTNDTNNPNPNIKKLFCMIEEIKEENDKFKNQYTQLESKYNMLKNEQTKLKKSTSSILRFLTNKYKDNPLMLIYSPNESKQLIDTVWNTSDEIKLGYILMCDYKNKKLVKYVSDCIISVLKHEDVMKQSVFSTDCTRLNYVIKNTVKQWSQDIKGIQVTTNIITPILDYIHKTINNYFNYIREKINNKEATEKEKDYIIEHAIYLIDFNTDIKLCKMHEKILKQITPHLKFSFPTL